MMVTMPITLEEFESQLQEITQKFGLQLNDDTRVAAMNYFHSIDRNEFLYDPDILGGYIHRAYSNQMTFDLAQSIRKKRKEEEAKNPSPPKPELTIVEPTPNH